MDRSARRHIPEYSNLRVYHSETQCRDNIKASHSSCALLKYLLKRNLTQEEKDRCVLQHIRCNVYQFYSLLFISIPFYFYLYIKL